jgi:hypothetical protein
VNRFVRAAGTGAVLLLVVSLTTSCAHVSPLQVTGVALDAAAVSFEATAAGMAAANASLTPAQRQAWNEFLPRFQASFHLAVSLWRSAHATGDASTEKQAAAILSTLLGQLGEFQAVVLAKNGGS